jgi:hypothetical protein
MNTLIKGEHGKPTNDDHWIGSEDGNNWWLILYDKLKESWERTDSTPYSGRLAEAEEFFKQVMSFGDLD